MIRVNATNRSSCITVVEVLPIMYHLYLICSLADLDNTGLKLMLCLVITTPDTEKISGDLIPVFFKFSEASTVLTYIVIYKAGVSLMT